METRHSFFLFFHLHYQWIVTFFSRFSILLVQGDHGSAKDATQGTMAKGEWIEKSEEKNITVHNIFQYAQKQLLVYDIIVLKYLRHIDLIRRI